MTKRVWINLDGLNGMALHSEASSLLESLGISTDYWSRTKAEISDEAFETLQKFEREHSDDPATWNDANGNPFTCSIVSELSDDEFASAHEVPVQIGRYTEYSWQRSIV